MRKYILILLLALTAASCATLRAPAKLERFVNRVERNADRYRPYQWERANRHYEALIREYIDNYRMYTIAEKQQAMSAIGRYHAILVDHGIKQGIGFLGSLGSYAGGLLDVLRQDVGAVEDFLQSVLGLGKKEIGNAVDLLKKNLAEYSAGCCSRRSCRARSAANPTARRDPTSRPRRCTSRRRWSGRNRTG